MKLYFAGMGSTRKMLRFFVESGLNDHPEVGVLVSYAYPRQFDNAVEAGVHRIMVDSGAFSADQSGTPIDYDEYLQFVVDRKDKIDIAVALDVIASGEESLRNYDHGRRFVPDIMPVWHIGESREILDYYVQNAPYVGIGGMAGDVVNWRRLSPALRKVFAWYPDHNFHAFGINDPRVTSLPFYSCDALTWRNGSRFGQIIVPGTRFHLGRTAKAISEADAEAFGLGDWIRSKGLPFPFPEDFHWDELDKLNLRTLVDLISDRDRSDVVDTFQQSLV